MKNLTILLVLLVLTIIINAQTTPPSIQWQKCFGGTGSELATMIQRTSDGGYIAGGYTDSNNGDVTGFHHNLYGGYDHYDYWIVKIDSSGNKQWQKCMGGSGDEEVRSIVQTPDGGYIIAGTTIVSGDGDVVDYYGNSDCWIVKLDSTGNFQWHKIYGGSYNDEANSIINTSDGNYVFAGYTASHDTDVTFNHNNDTIGFWVGDFWVVKIDTSGNILWQKCFGGTECEMASSIQQTADGGFIVAGYTGSYDGDVTGYHNPTGYIGMPDYWVVKLDTSGNIQWQKCLGGFNNEKVSSLIQTTDGGYIIVGSTLSYDGDVTGNHDTTCQYFDGWVVKIDTSGNIQWQKCIGGTYDDYFSSVIQTSDGGFILAGCTGSNDGDVSGNHDTTYFHYTDAWLVKLDTSGNIQWQKCFGSSSSDLACSIIEINNGYYVFAGMAFVNNGDVTGCHGGYYLGDFWVVKLGPTPSNIIEQNHALDVSIYPNPSTSKFTVEIPPATQYVKISNSLGQVLEKRPVYNQTELNFTIKETGIYFVQIINNKKSITKKIVISN